jgi:hypothetical protein
MPASPTPPPTAVSIDFSVATGPGGVVSRMHGISQGPIIKAAWLDHMPRQPTTTNFTAGFARSEVPSVRVHGMGCIDMDQLWRPYPNYAGQDASDEANYDWTIADECMKNVYSNAALPGLNATIRLGHSRAMRAQYPHYCEGPDDDEVFANVSAAIMRRYLVVKSYPVRDFSVWNEPSNPGSSSPFYCRGPYEYASMYNAVWRRAKAEFGASIAIGAAVGLDDFTRTALSAIVGNGSSANFVDIHIYPSTPSAIPYRIHAKPQRGNLEDMLEDSGLSRTTRVQVGEWSRSIGLDYATDGPGAAFIGCGLVYLDGMTPANSGGAHAVADAFLYAAGKVWEGGQPGSPDMNAATVLNWWGGRMAGGLHLATSGARMPSAAHPNSDDLAVAAAARGGDANGDATSEVNALIAHYMIEPSTPNVKPPTLACFDLSIDLQHVPWTRWSWTQYANVAPGALAAVAWGNGTGTSASLALQMHGNSYSTLHVSPSAVPEGALHPGFPIDAAYSAATAQAIASQACSPPPPRSPPPLSPPLAPTDKSSAGTWAAIGSAVGGIGAATGLACVYAKIRGRGEMCSTRAARTSNQIVLEGADLRSRG